MTARFAPTTLRVDTSKLSAGDRQALVKLIEAGRIMNDIFLVQYWSGDPALYARLQKDKTPLGKARLQYFWINKGPWSALDEFQGLSSRRSGGEAQGSKFLSRGHDQGGIRDLGCAPCRRNSRRRPRDSSPSSAGTSDAGAKTLVAVPYSEEYKDDLTRAANLLKEAANLTDNASLKNFSQPARGCVSLQRLLRQRYGLDGSGRAHRHHHRPLRNLQRRTLRLQSGLRRPS